MKLRCRCFFNDATLQRFFLCVKNAVVTLVADSHMKYVKSHVPVLLVLFHIITRHFKCIWKYNYRFEVHRIKIIEPLFGLAILTATSRRGLLLHGLNGHPGRQNYSTAIINVWPTGISILHFLYTVDFLDLWKLVDGSLDLYSLASSNSLELHIDSSSLARFAAKGYYSRVRCPSALEIELHGPLIVKLSWMFLKASMFSIPVRFIPCWRGWSIFTSIPLRNCQRGMICSHRELYQ